jgi:hypothetical protein
MSNFRELATRAERIVADNSPTILTAIGVTGTVATAVLTGKATYKYMELLEELKEYDREHPVELTGREHVELAWKFYIPAVGSGVLTIAAIIGANRVGTRRAAGLAAAYALSEKAFVEYRDKVAERLTPAKEMAIRDEVAQDRLSRTPGSSEIVIVGTDVLCMDAYSGRYFTSNMEALKKAQNDLNYRVLNDMYASLSDFYNLIGLSTTSMSDEVGWKSDKPMEIHFTTGLAEDGRPCIVLNFMVEPMRDYTRLW